MKQRINSIVLTTTLVIFVFVAFSATASAAIINVPSAGNETIQQAINNASAGDTILVNATAYNAQGIPETVIVNRSDIIIRSVNGTAVVSACGADDHVFNITDQTNITLIGFEIRDARGTSQSVAGIYMNNASECNISGNSVTNISATGWDAYGIYLSSSSNNNSFHTTTVYNLSAGDDAYGIWLSSSSNNNSFHTTTVYNLSAGDDAYGIYLSSSSNNNSFHTTTVYNLSAGNDAYGIYLYSSSNNNSFDTSTVYNLSADDIARGIYLRDSSNNSFSTSTSVSHIDTNVDAYGIYLGFYSNNNTFSSSTTVSYINATLTTDEEASAYGIRLYHNSTNNSFDTSTTVSYINATASGDEVGAYAYGICLKDSSTNNSFSSSTTVSYATATASGVDTEAYAYGIDLTFSSDNSFSSTTSVSHIDANDNAYGIYLRWSSSDNSFNSGSISDINASTWWDFYSDASSHGNSAENITISSYPTTISFTYDNGVGIKSVTTPESDPAGKVNISKYVNATNVTANSWLFLNVSYEDVDLGGVDENSLRMWKHNGTDWTEVAGTNGTNTAENYVYANITEFGSIFAPLGNTSGPPVNCTCGDICVNETGWWRDGGAFNLNNTPIQAAIDNATVGETICVKNGTYNETVDVNKTINLTGAGKDTTTIDGTGGSTNTVNITAEGVEIHGFNVTGNASHHGIYVTAAGFNIHDNEFYSDTGSGYAILVNITRKNVGSTSLDDMDIRDNYLHGGRGIRFDSIWFDTPDPGSDIVVGNITISGNEIVIQSGYGISMELYLESMNGGNVTWHDTMVVNNTIAAPEGIYFYGGLWNLTEVNAAVGDFVFDENIINATGGTGLDIGWWDIYNIHGNTSITVGRTTVLNNTIECTEDGIAFWFDYLYYYNQTTISIDDFIVTGNNITANGTGAEGISFYGEIGTMDPGTDAQLGNFTFSHNTINATEEGIYFYIYSPDTSLSRFGDLTVTNNNVTAGGWAALVIMPLDLDHVNEGLDITVGDVNISDNVIHESGGEGIYFWGEFYNLTNGSLTIGDLDISRNIIDPPTIGIDIEWWYIYDIHGSTSITVGKTTVLNNTIECTSDGIDIWFYYLYQYYNQTTISIDDFIVTGNNITANGTGADGIYFDGEIGTMDPGTDAQLGNFTFSHNTINATEEGIYFYIYSPDTSLSRFGDLTITNNIVNSSSGTAALDIEPLDMYVNEGVDITVGDVTISDNVIHESGGEGIYFWSGFYDLTNGSLTIGDLDISRNIIDPPTIGIDIDWWEFYNIHGNTSITTGTTTVLNNSIECTDDGIAFWFESLEQYYNQTTISIDDFIVTGNNITANGTEADGIYFDGKIGTMDPGTDAQLGNFTFSYNTINATEEGIYFYIYSPDTSLSRFGDLTVTNNNVTAGGWGALGIMPLEMYVNEGVDITVGDVTISDNVIHESGGEGIYFWSGFYDLTNGSLTIGDLDISRNIIDPPTIGIDIDWWDIYNIHGNTSITTGTTTVLNNSIECTDDGIAFWFESLEQYYNQTTISIDDFIVTGNNITANGTEADGIYFDGEIGTMDPGTDAQLGNFTFSHNTINATEEGIYFYIYSPDTSLSRFGDLTVTNNNVTAGGWGALDIMPLDLDHVNEGLDITVGDVTISDNVIHESGGEGIYFWGEFYDLTNGSLTIGDLDISRNIIDPPTIGIDIEWWYIYNIHGNTSITTGTTTVLNNSIECTDDGIYFLLDNIGPLYDQTTISISDVIVEGNSISCVNGLNVEVDVTSRESGNVRQLPINNLPECRLDGDIPLW